MTRDEYLRVLNLANKIAENKAEVIQDQNAIYLDPESELKLSIQNPNCVEDLKKSLNDVFKKI